MLRSAIRSPVRTAVRSSVKGDAAGDTEAPTGYAVEFPAASYRLGEDTSSVSLNVTGAEVGAAWAVSVSSSGGGTPVTSSGTVASASFSITGLDLSGLTAGTLTASLVLTDDAENEGDPATDTATLNAAWDADAVSYWTRFSTPPSDARKALLSAAIAATKTAGLWAGIHQLLVYAGNDSQCALLNAKAASNDATAVNSPTFTQDRGFTGNGTSSYIGHNLAPSGVTGWTENLGTMGAWNLSTGVANSGVLLGVQGAGGIILQQRRNTDGVVYARVNTTTTPTQTSATITGFHSTTRRGAAEQEIYINGASIGTFDPSPGTAAPSATEFSSLRSNAVYSNRQIALAVIAGDDWTDADHTAFYNAWLPYMQGVGAA